MNHIGWRSLLNKRNKWSKVQTLIVFNSKKVPRKNNTKFKAMYQTNRNRAKRLMKF